MFLVVLGVLVAAPAVFCVAWADLGLKKQVMGQKHSPSSAVLRISNVCLLLSAVLIELSSESDRILQSWTLPDARRKETAIGLLGWRHATGHRVEPGGDGWSFSLYLIFVMVGILMTLALVYKCCGMEELLKALRRGEKRSARWFLLWRSVTHLCTRWVVMLVMVLATVLLVYTAELWDYGERRMQDGPAMRPAEVFLFILLPLWFIWPASFLLQWRVFGPVTKQALLTPFFDAELVGKYTDQASGMSLQRAFYQGGVDMSMADVALCPAVPILLFGATLNEFQRPESTEAHSLFVGA
eukprot:s100_g26.t1